MYIVWRHILKMCWRLKTSSASASVSISFPLSVYCWSDPLSVYWWSDPLSVYCWSDPLSVYCWSDPLSVNCWSDQHVNCWSSQLFVSWHPRSEGFIWRTFLSQIWLFMKDINSYNSGIDLIEDLKLISWFLASLSIYIETFISWMLMICIVFSILLNWRELLSSFSRFELVSSCSWWWHLLQIDEDTLN